MIEAAPTAHVADGVTTDEIRTEYHPKSGKPTKVCRFEEYNSDSTLPRHTTVADPWWPDFKSREDFSYAEIIHQAHLSNDLSDKLIKLINRCLEGKGEFTFKGHADVETAWKCASSRLTAVSQS
jgi:hypothetical protein